MATKKQTRRTSFRPDTFLKVVSAREGTIQEKAAKFLAKTYGKPVPVEALCKAVYGKKDAPAITMVLSGINAKLREAKAGYEAVRKDGTVSLAA